MAIAHRLILCSRDEWRLRTGSFFVVGIYLVAKILIFQKHPSFQRTGHVLWSSLAANVLEWSQRPLASCETLPSL